MARRHLGADARLALGHHREGEADDVHALLQQLGRHLARQPRIAQHYRNDGVLARHEGEAGRAHFLAEQLGVASHFGAQLGTLAALKDVQHFQAGGGDGRSQSVGEQVRTRALTQQIDDGFAAGHIAAGRAAQGLAQGAGVDVDAIGDSAQFRRASAAVADEADGVGVVHHHQRAMTLSHFAQGFQVGNDAVHREYAIGDDQLEARTGLFRGDQLRFQICHIIVLVAEALGLGQAHAVDDGGVVELVGNHRVFFAQQGFEHAAVGVEAAGIQDGIVGAQKARNRLLQVLMHLLGAADEADRGAAVAEVVHALFRRLDQTRVVGQAKVIVGAKIQHIAAVAQGDVGALRRGDHALGLFKTVGANLRQRGFKMG